MWYHATDYLFLEYFAACSGHAEYHVLGEFVEGTEEAAGDYRDLDELLDDWVVETVDLTDYLAYHQGNIKGL